MVASARKRRALNKAYYEKHKEEIRIKSREYYKANGEARKANAEARKAAGRAYYRANAEARKAAARAYYQANAEARKAAARANSKAYYQANTEAKKAAAKAYYHVNAEARRAASRAYYQANAEKMKIARQNKKRKMECEMGLIDETITKRGRKGGSSKAQPEHTSSHTLGSSPTDNKTSEKTAVNTDPTHLFTINHSSSYLLPKGSGSSLSWPQNACPDASSCTKLEHGGGVTDVGHGSDDSWDEAEIERLREEFGGSWSSIHWLHSKSEGEGASHAVVSCDKSTATSLDSPALFQSDGPWDNEIPCTSKDAKRQREGDCTAVKNNIGDAKKKKDIIKKKVLKKSTEGRPVNSFPIPSPAPSLEVCPDCLVDVDSSAVSEFNDWNKAEVERLKEGLRKFGRVWGKISRQSGVNKSAKQCKEYFNTHCAIENVGLLQAVADHVMKTAIHNKERELGLCSASSSKATQSESPKSSMPRRPKANPSLGISSRRICQTKKRIGNRGTYSNVVLVSKTCSSPRMYDRLQCHSLTPPSTRRVSSSKVANMYTRTYPSSLRRSTCTHKSRSTTTTSESSFTLLSRSLTNNSSVSSHLLNVCSHNSLSQTDGAIIHFGSTQLSPTVSTRPKSDQPVVRQSCLTSVCSLVDQLVSGTSWQSNIDDGTGCSEAGVSSMPVSLVGIL